jgi:hypothetical protein
MIWTHTYDLILKLLTLFLSIFCLTQIPYLENNEVSIVIGIILFFVVYNLYVRTLATYLYCKFTLKMNVDIIQAKKINGAFSPIFNIKWLPMRELRELDETNNKYETALSTYEKWEEEKKQNRNIQWEKFKNDKLKNKILKIIMYILLGYFMIAAFLNLPPANLLTLTFCRLFDTNEYYPILNLLILVLPIILLFKIFDKILNNNSYKKH